jgi:hypothetical protein
MESKDQILLVVNPISGSFDKTNLIESVQTNLSGKNLNLQVYETQGKNDEKAINDLIF